ncbi:hypothetical protein HPB47_025475 [Ixodes persulcatus]|uniref:Uncharacterized protein n=1 Tax=Ixodes persulcatus TaxID=34615 RepID=A0AC60Q367_IXOPE|nr:hypothetical protein HPB47_025475 [Ixodes persulcatus]
MLLRDKGVLRTVFMAVASVFGYAILIFLQYGLLALLAFRRAANKIKHKVTFPHLNSGTGHSGLLTLRECVRNVKQVPKDAGMAVLEETVDLHAVARFVLWCMAVGIKTLAVYDINGTVLEKIEQFKTVMKDALQDARCPKDAVQFVENSDDAKKINGTAEVKLYVIGPEAGRAGLATALGTLCEDYKCGLLKDEDVTQDTVDKYIKNQANGMPDPEIIFRFGNSNALLGYPPWHVNHSEILDLGYHRDVLPSEFVEVLEIYSKIEKRYGK